METERHFLAFADSEGQNIYINVLQIRQVILSEEHCEVLFSDTHRIRLAGVGMVAFLERLAERSIALNGEPIALRSPSIMESQESS